jgi:hypothetical protein
MQHRGEKLTDTESSEIRALIERIGERQACAYLGVSAHTIARAVGAMHVQRGTIALLRQRLAEIQRAA